MSTYITATRCKYEINDLKLERAEKWLVDNNIVSDASEISSAAYRSGGFCDHGTSIVSGTMEGLFGGEVPYSWDEEVSEFMREFCLPGSYATFRLDDDYEWVMAQVDSLGNVVWHSVGWDNPWEKECDALEVAE